MSGSAAAEGPTGGWAWAQVPRPGGRRGRARPPLAPLWALLVAGAGAVARTAVSYEPSRVVVVALLVGLAVGALQRVEGARRGVVVVAAVAVMVIVARFQAGLWVGAGLVLADWAVFGRPPLRRLPPPTGASVAPAVVLALIAGWRATSHFSWSVPLVWILASVVAVVVTGRHPDLPRRVGEAVGRVVTVVLFGALGLAAVVLPWMWHRLSGTDPLAAGEGRWDRLRVADVAPDRPWLTGPLSPSRSWRRRVALMSVAALLAGLGWVVIDRDTAPAGRRAYSLADVAGTVTTDEIPAAYRDAPWYADYREDLDHAAAWLGLFPVIDGQPPPDIRSEHLNLTDGVRHSWRAPACGCRRLTVWVYGASTIFGVGQRDEHTIPSELARVAWEEGITLDVVNRGVAGNQHWQEADRLAWDLTQDPTPDLVVFYDGASDLVAASWLDDRRLGDVPFAVEPQTEEFLDHPAITTFLSERLQGDRERPPAPPGVFGVEPELVDPLSPEGVGELAARRYERSRQRSVASLDANGIAAAWFWQPTRLSRPEVDGEPTTDRDDRSRRAYAAATAAIADDVVDLSGVLDGIAEPLFSDDAHHNEVGARLVAEAMFAELRERLQQLASEEVPG